MSENMNETMNENEGVTVTLTLDNDETLECAVLTIYEAAGRQYIALLPLDENGEESEESDVYIYRFSETEDGEPNLETSKMTTSTMLLPTNSMNGWIPWNLTRSILTLSKSDALEQFLYKTGRRDLLSVFISHM